jgi:hypothetical protein
MNTAHDVNRSYLIHNMNHIIFIQSNQQCLAFNALPQVTVDFVCALLNSLFFVSIVLESLSSMIVDIDFWTPTHTREIFTANHSTRWSSFVHPFHVVDVGHYFSYSLLSDSRTYFYCHSMLSHQLAMLMSSLASSVLHQLKKVSLSNYVSNHVSHPFSSMIAMDLSIHRVTVRKDTCWYVRVNS